MSCTTDPPLKGTMLHRKTLLIPAVAVLALTGCAGGAAPAETPEPTSAGHGAVEGAAEVSEPQLHLTTIDPEGSVTQLDLLDESVVDVGAIDAASAMTTDGRYLFASGSEGVAIVDSGMWTWDHVDHFHYYRGTPSVVGTVPGEGDAVVATTNLSTTGSTGLFFADSGEAVLLDTEALSKRELVERFRLELEPQAGVLAPIGSHALLAADGVVQVLSAEGEPSGPAADCVDPGGTITTRVGAVIGCADGALLATVDGDEVALETIAYPADAAPRATSFVNREGRPTVAALAGEQGVWLLDTRERTWTLLPAPAPLVQVTAVDDDAEHVLALAADGRVLVLDGSGAQLAATEPLVDASQPGATLIADQQRAYLSAPAEGLLVEIDFADGARIARTFETATEPAFTALTGR